MKLLAPMIFLLLMFGFINASGAVANDLSGYMAAEGRFFFNDPLFPKQERNDASVAIQPEYYHEWENGSSFTTTLFARLDSADSERTHFDVRGNWLWKLEVLYRTGQGDDFFAGVGGFEYSFVNIAQTGMDLGLIIEWAYDERGQEATTEFQNDAIIGLRLALNDAASSELLIGFSQDLESTARLLSVEASRRFGNNWLLSIESRAFFDLPEDDLFYSMRDDDYLQIELAYYF
jgi:hypothetical protein